MTARTMPDRLRIPTLLAVALLLAAGPSQAVEWYTVTGDKANAEIDTTQIDTSTLDRRNDLLGLRFRVTLAKLRKPGNGGTGGTYQSYLSHIAVECGSGSIFHEDQRRFQEPMWSGPSTFERFQQPRPMAFGGLSPDPRPLILDMACGKKAVSRQ